MKSSAHAKAVTTAAQVAVAPKGAAKRAPVKAAPAKRTKAGAGKLVIGRVQPAGKLTVTFGEVSVHVAQPTQEAVQKSVKASVKVIRELGKRLLTPGVEIKQANDIPVFTADPQNPARVIRQLNGKSEVGHFVRGKFKADTVSA